MSVDESDDIGTGDSGPAPEVTVRREGDVRAEADRRGLAIDQVSRLLGIPTPTIRSWERRHGVPVVSRTAGGHRRYTGEQVDMLRRLRDLVAQGRRPVDAAAAVRSEQHTSPAPLVGAFLQAARALQPSAIIEILNTAQQTLGLGRTVDEVLLPALREVGEWWQHDEANVLPEHLATHATQTWLAQAGSARARQGRAGPVILCCGPRDQHTLALEAMAALLRERGCDCRVLGARTPESSLVRAVGDTAAVAVVLVCHLSANRPAAVEALRRTAATPAHLFYAGGGFSSRQARQGLPGRYLGTNLSQAVELVTESLPSSTGAGAPRQ